jgi:hypothetical protein
MAAGACGASFEMRAQEGALLRMRVSVGLDISKTAGRCVHAVAQ